MDESTTAADEQAPPGERLLDEQARVAAFVDRHDLTMPPEFRLLDVVSEVGEIAKDAADSTEYGENPDDLTVSPDELGDVLFAVLALANALDIDASDALEEALEKYSDRLATGDDPSSGR